MTVLYSCIRCGVRSASGRHVEIDASNNATIECACGLRVGAPISDSTLLDLLESGAHLAVADTPQELAEVSTEAVQEENRRLAGELAACVYLIGNLRTELARLGHVSICEECAQNECEC